MDESLRKLFEDAMPKETDQLLTEDQQNLREVMKETSVNARTGETGMTDEQADELMKQLGGPQAMEALAETQKAMQEVADLAAKGKDVAMAGIDLCTELHDFLWHTESGSAECKGGHSDEGIPAALLESYTILQLKIKTLREMWIQGEKNTHEATERALRELKQQMESDGAEMPQTLKDFLDGLSYNQDDAPEA